MGEVLMEILSAAVEVCMFAGRWFFPAKERTALRFAAGCLVLTVGMALVAIFAVLLIVNLALK